MWIKQLGLAGAALAVLAGCGAESNSKPAASAPRLHLVELAKAEPGRVSYTAARAGSLRAVPEVRFLNREEGRLTAVRVRVGVRV
jgi:multidrug efflux pump subunit AcrA (membrane-fusion protein)